MPDIYNIYGTTSTNYIQENLYTTFYWSDL